MSGRGGGEGGLRGEVQEERGRTRLEITGVEIMGQSVTNIF